ncbi:MAG TPA: hypothetical protein VER11_34310 [Polyangiaceae bacterium]|nr:hypothetical protein [Polyangiaceae bacterium]
MTPPRRSEAQNLSAAQELHHDTEPPPPVEPKKLTPMAEAVKLAGAISKIDKHEADYISNARVRYQAERDALLATASGKAKKILAAAAVEEPEA